MDLHVVILLDSVAQQDRYYRTITCFYLLFSTVFPNLSDNRNLFPQIPNPRIKGLRNQIVLSWPIYKISNLD